LGAHVRFPYLLQLTEYGIMVALIAAVSIGVVTTLGGSVSSAFNALVTKL